MVARVMQRNSAAMHQVMPGDVKMMLIRVSFVALRAEWEDVNLNFILICQHSFDQPGFCQFLTAQNHEIYKVSLHHQEKYTLLNVFEAIKPFIHKIWL